MRTASEINREQDEKYSLDIPAVASIIADACHNAAMQTGAVDHINCLKVLEKHIVDYANAYMVGKSSPFSHVVKELQKNGYGVQLHTGGHSGGAAVNVTWIPNKHNYRYQ